MPPQKYTQNPLLVACRKGNIACVTELLKKGSKVHGYYRFYSPLARAAKHGHKDIVELLLNHGADVNGKDNKHCITPLAVTFYRGKFNPDMADLLLSRGADVNCIIPGTRFKSGETILFDAIRCGNAEVVDYLLDHGADINIVDSFGRTALEIACEANRFKFTQSLLLLGADSGSFVLKEHVSVEITNLIMGCRAVDSMSKTVHWFQAVCSCDGFILLPFPIEIIIHIASFLTNIKFRISEFEQVMAIANSLPLPQHGRYRVNELFKILCRFANR